MFTPPYVQETSSLVTKRPLFGGDRRRDITDKPQSANAIIGAGLRADILDNGVYRGVSSIGIRLRGDHINHHIPVAAEVKGDIGTAGRPEHDELISIFPGVAQLPPLDLKPPR
ncbi:hypothetical protein LNP05_09740 [Klebsiella pneumoniae subsp. pneumoniae]|nr:hypothetical protein [Klebsiella pneumoniae subsp. pneumoniae]